MCLAQVRVLCRVKPATAPVLALGAGGAYVVADAEGGARRFDFDAVVGPEDGQAVVLAAVADLALSALDGDKVLPPRRQIRRPLGFPHACPP